jgi:predicted alpha/beta-hydrolase family hydrolase
MGATMLEEDCALRDGRRVPLSVCGQPDGGRTIVLAPGAGSDRRHPFLVALQETLAAAGWTAVTFDFPYRAAGRKLPDPRPVLEAAWRAALRHVAERFGARDVGIGGRSMGGRMAAHVAADGAAVQGLVFLGFPLHPAGKPDVARAEPLGRITAPMLFVQGTRDALADRALLRGVLDGMPRATLVEIPEADHGFRVPKRLGTEASVRATIADAVIRWLDALPRA